MNNTEHVHNFCNGEDGGRTYSCDCGEWMPTDEEIQIGILEAEITDLKLKNRSLMGLLRFVEVNARFPTPEISVNDTLGEASVALAYLAVGYLAGSVVQAVWGMLF